MAPDLRLQGWTHGRARAQSEEEEKQRRGGQGREGVGFRARGVLSSPASLESSSPAATFQGHWEKALYSNKQGSPLSHDPRAALVGHTHPLRPTPPPPPAARHSRQPASAAPSTCRWGLAFHFDPHAHHQAPEPVKAHKPTRG